MKILILANSSNGLYRFRKMLLDRLKAKGHEIYCVTPIINYKEELKTICELEDIHIDRRGINPIKDIKYFFNCMKAIERIKPDMVLTYTIKPNIYGGLACRLKKIPYYANITGLGTGFQNDNIIRKIIVKMYKIALKKVQTVFFQNQGNKDVFIKDRIIQEDKVCMLNGSGVDLQEFPFKQMPEESKNINFLFIGRVMKEKGVDELFQAIEKIKKEYKNAEFSFIGGMQEDYKNKLKELEEKGLIKYYGSVKNVQDYIENAHCIVLPSYHEGMSNALLEGAAMGRALIASDIHGCKEAVIDNKTGFLCKAKDQVSLYECLKKFIMLSYKKKEEMGLASRKHMEENFDKKEIVKKTINRLKLN